LDHIMQKLGGIAQSPEAKEANQVMRPEHHSPMPPHGILQRNARQGISPQ